MSGTVFRYVTRLYAGFFAAVFAVVLAIFLIADYSDRVKAFAGHRALDVLELYWNKAQVNAHLLGPAAMLLAGAAAVSTLRKRGELTAMRSLAFSPASLYLPIGLAALVGAGALIAFDELVVTRASARVDEIHVNRFNSWGDWRFFHSPKRWFRRGSWVFHLRAGEWEQGFEEVTLLELGSDFGLARRIDADRMTHAEGSLWELAGVSDRRFLPDGTVRQTSSERERIDLGVPREALRIRPGRPEQMRVSELLEQIDARSKLGLPAQRLKLALHNRFAYPLTGFAAALLSIGIALRPGRKGHLTVALVEGLSIAVALWGMMVIGKALVLAEHVRPSVVAWAPFVLLSLAAVGLWLRREGRLGRSGF